MTTGQKAVTAVLRQQTLTLQAQGETTVIPMSDIVSLLRCVLRFELSVCGCRWARR